MLRYLRGSTQHFFPLKLYVVILHYNENANQSPGELRKLLNPNWSKQLGINVEAFGLWIILLCGPKEILKNDNTKERVIIMSV